VKAAPNVVRAKTALNTRRIPVGSSVAGVPVPVGGGGALIVGGIDGILVGATETVGTKDMVGENETVGE